ncbi:TolC family protein [Variovorax robiniae]|uniref:TolC family protein n=1 Tax=Variovorax robiniae TaxID=1836199 RepID=A0ABU8XJL8_9BURK
MLKDRGNPISGAGLSMLVPLFRGGASQAQVDARTAEQNLAAAAWAQTAMKALNEVEAALAEEATLRQREPIIDAQIREAQRVL